MGIRVQVHCAWCAGMKETTIESPLPEGWRNEEVMSPKPSDDGGREPGFVTETFCSPECWTAYEEAAPAAHDAAARDYTAKFYSTMREVRGNG